MKQRDRARTTHLPRRKRARTSRTMEGRRTRRGRLSPVSSLKELPHSFCQFSGLRLWVSSSQVERGQNSEHPGRLRVAGAMMEVVLW